MQDIARQASCTLLAIFTIFCALGVTAGGVLYAARPWISVGTATLSLYAEPKRGAMHEL